MGLISRVADLDNFALDPDLVFEIPDPDPA